MLGSIGVSLPCDPVCMGERCSENEGCVVGVWLAMVAQVMTLLVRTLHKVCEHVWCVCVMCMCVCVVCMCDVYVWCACVVCMCGVYVWCVYVWCVCVVCMCGVYVTSHTLVSH